MLASRALIWNAGVIPGTSLARADMILSLMFLGRENAITNFLATGSVGIIVLSHISLNSNRDKPFGWNS